MENLYKKFFLLLNVTKKDKIIWISRKKRGERRIPTIDTVIKKRSIEDFEIFPAKYIEKVMAENALLERAVNLILQNEKTEKTLVEKIMESAGTECFTKFDDGTYAWKGL
nr:MAG TPA: Protein of unknown function (DUF563) [Caudoviricetes sp.]